MDLIDKIQERLDSLLQFNDSGKLIYYESYIIISKHKVQNRSSIFGPVFECNGTEIYFDYYCTGMDSIKLDSIKDLDKDVLFNLEINYNSEIYCTLIFIILYLRKTNSNYAVFFSDVIYGYIQGYIR